MGCRARRDAELTMRIVIEDLTHPDVLALIDLHLRSAFANSPPGSVFALDPSGLRAPGVTLWSAWDGEELLGMGALKHLSDDHGELKSMRTVPAHLRKGVGAAMLEHLVTEARRRGYRRLSLETGNSIAFAPARALYERMSFAPCAPFDGYTDESFSQYYTLAL